MNSTEFENGNGVYTSESSTSKTVKFYLLLLGESIALPSYIFVLYHLLTHRTLYRAIHNHVTIVNLFVNVAIILIDFTCHLIYLHRGVLVPSLPVLCLAWQYMDYGFWFGDLSLKLWTAIERHILIFHSNLLRSARQRLLFHYIPLMVFAAYSPIVYIGLVFFYPTEFTYDFHVVLCGGPYYFNAIPAWLIWYESLAHYIIPITLMLGFAGALPIRVLLQKNRLHVNTSWRHYRKMTIELIFIKMIYIFDLPYIIVTIVRWSGFSQFGIDFQGPYFFYCNYIPIVLFPFATIGSLPNLTHKIKRLFVTRRLRPSVIIVPQRVRPMQRHVADRENTSNC